MSFYVENSESGDAISILRRKASKRFKDKMLEFLSWLEITGCVPEASRRRFELENFLEDFYDAGVLDERDRR